MKLFFSFNISLSEGTGTYCNGKADLYRDEKNTKESTKTDNEVVFIDLPYLISSRDINKSNHSSDNDCTQHHIWCVLEEWHEKQEGNHNCYCHYNIGSGSFASCIVIYS